MLDFGFSLGFKKEIDLNQRMSAIFSLFNESVYKQLIVSPGLIVFNNDLGSNFVINPSNFQYNLAHSYETKELFCELDLVQKIANLFLAGEDLLSSLRLVDVANCGKDVFTLSRSSFNLDLTAGPFSGVDGIGIRLISKNENITMLNGKNETVFEEFKCEPYIREENTVYFEENRFFIYNEQFNLEDECRQVFSLFEKKRNAILERL